MKILTLLTILYSLPFIHSWGTCPRYHYKKHQPRAIFLSKLPDSHQLNNTALVGTVSSLAIVQNGQWNLGQTQELSLGDQMKYGIRLIEISVRASPSSDDLFLYSRSGYLKTTFNYVLEEINRFLTTNPGEFIILYIHEEIDYYSTSKNNCRLIDQFNSSSAGQRLTSNWKLNNTIGLLRGKILLATSSTTFNQCAVNLYKYCEIQETKVSNYISFSPQQAKWYAVQKLQTESFSLKRICFVNYVIDHDDVFGPLYAKESFPNRENKCEEPLNYRMAKFFQNPHRAFMIIMAADITQELIDRVIITNFVN